MINLDFYLTEEQACPYLDGRTERKLFTHLYSCKATQVCSALSERGFRRSQSIAYMPACHECSECVSVRIPVLNFHPSKSQKRIIGKNLNLSRFVNDAKPGLEHYRLFKRYLECRHSNGAMAQMTEYEFLEMVSASPVKTKLVDYYTPNNELVASCLIDCLTDGISLVYSFFDPDLRKNSLGKFIILDILHWCKTDDSNMHYVYLGYAVKNSTKMQYKYSFSPLEMFRNGVWYQVA